MANTKILADGTAITAWWALPNYAAIPAKPTVAELNAARDITCDIAWDGFSFGAQASNQTSDPSLCDVGNRQTRGFAQFGGTISIFLPNSYWPLDANNTTQGTFYALGTPLTVGYLIIRVDGRKTTAGVADAAKPAVAGDFVSIYKVMSDGYTDVNTGDVNFKTQISLVPQGDLWVNAIVDTSPTIATPVPIGATGLVSPTGKTPLGTYWTGRQLAAAAGFWNGTPGWFDWQTSTPTTVRVDKNGVMYALAPGAFSVTATDRVTGITSTAYSGTIT